MRVFGIVFALLLIAPLVFADETEEKVRQAMKNIEELRKKAEVLQDRGRMDEARRLRQEAEDRHAELNAWIKRLKKERAGRGKRLEGDRLEGVLRGLNNGIEALMAIGMKEEAAHLKEIADGVRRRMEFGKQRADIEKRAASKEHAVARRYIKILRIAMKALLEAKRQESAELVEHQIHAIELRLERRRDEKAMKVYRTAPKPGAMAELMALAGEILQDRGNKEAAHAVRDMHKMYLDQHRRQRGERREPREREERREHRARAEFGKDDRALARREMERREAERREHLARRVEQLERRLAELTEILDELTEETGRRKR
ncbi:MAG: hypothetical protein ACYTGZ_17625 [Planctomycetota bacterium]|jgi:hypothetical protein